MLPDGSPFFDTHDGANRDMLVSPTQLVPGRWHHVAASWDDTTKRMLVDGVLVAESTAPIGFEGGILVLGADIDDDVPYNHLPGALDDVRIYRRALDAADLAAAVAP